MGRWMAAGPVADDPGAQADSMIACLPQCEYHHALPSIQRHHEKHMTIIPSEFGSKTQSRHYREDLLRPLESVHPGTSDPRTRWLPYMALNRTIADRLHRRNRHRGLDTGELPKPGDIYPETAGIKSDTSEINTPNQTICRTCVRLGIVPFVLLLGCITNLPLIPLTEHALAQQSQPLPRRHGPGTDHADVLLDRDRIRVDRARLQSCVAGGTSPSSSCSSVYVIGGGIHPRWRCAGLSEGQPERLWRLDS